MRSALLAIDGVARVQVALDTGEAVVTYDPRRAATDAMVRAVGAAQGPVPSIKYKATVKEGAGPADSAR